MARLKFTGTFLNTVQRWVERESPFLQEQLSQPYTADDWLVGDGWMKMGAAARILGRPADAATAFAIASVHYWPYDTPQLTRAFAGPDSAGHQCQAAIAASLAGDQERSRMLFEWSILSHEELPPVYERWQWGGRYDSGYWRHQFYWAYAEARLGRWEQVAGRARLAALSLERVRKRGDSPYLAETGLAYILQALGEYRLNPTPEGREAAQSRLLELFNRWCRQPIIRMRACYYAWDLQEAFPDVFAPVIPG